MGADDGEKAFSELVEAVIELADARQSDRDGRLNDRAIVSGCRAFLRFTEPREPAALAVKDALTASAARVDIRERRFRELVDQLMRQAQQHVAESDDDAAFLEYLRILRA